MHNGSDQPQRRPESKATETLAREQRWGRRADCRPRALAAYVAPFLYLLCRVSQDALRPTRPGAERLGSAFPRRAWERAWVLGRSTNFVYRESPCPTLFFSPTA